MKIISLLSILVFYPIIALAQQFVGPPAPGTASGLGLVLDRLADIVGGITPLIVALALLFFFFGLAKYILSAGDEEKKSQGRSIMIWGIIALFVMVSVWGLVRLVQETFDLQNSAGGVPAPGINLPSGGGQSTTF
jgi:uncharacterized membrane protein